MDTSSWPYDLWKDEDDKTMKTDKTLTTESLIS